MTPEQISQLRSILQEHRIVGVTVHMTEKGCLIDWGESGKKEHKSFECAQEDIMKTILFVQMINDSAITKK